MGLPPSDWSSIAEIISGIAVVVRLDLYVNMIFNMYEKAYFAYRYGVMGQGEWGRYTGQVCAQLRSADQVPGFWEGLASSLTEEFHSYVNDLCRSGQ